MKKARLYVPRMCDKTLRKIDQIKREREKESEME